MASSSETDITHRRWLVVGTVLNRVLMPCLRMKIQQEMTPFYQKLVAKFGIDKQIYRSHQKTVPTSAIRLNYESINHNGRRSFLLFKQLHECTVRSNEWEKQQKKKVGGGGGQGEGDENFIFKSRSLRGMFILVLYGHAWWNTCKIDPGDRESQPVKFFL